MMDDKDAQQDELTLAEFNALMAEVEALDILLKSLQQRRVTFGVLPGSVLNVTGIVTDSERADIERFEAIIIARVRQHRVEVCSYPSVHRRNWYYAGKGMFKCEVCERYNKWPAA